MRNLHAHPIPSANKRAHSCISLLRWECQSLESSFSPFIRPLRHRYAWGLCTVFSFLVGSTLQLPLKPINQPFLHSVEQKWIASGSFDRTIKLWDMTRTNIDAPLLTLNPPLPSVPKSSIYALAADPHGHAIASGSPERVVRMWDPRSGKRTAKLVGHTDNIRAILISDDAKYVSAHVLGLDVCV